jgi:hypothetical protein
MAKDALKKSLKDRAKEFDKSLPFMEGREKGKTEHIVDATLTITDYGFLTDDDGKDYVCFIVKEKPQHFYFGGQVLTNNIKELDEDGFGDEIRKEGLPARFTERVSKRSKKTYTAVEFYPEA